VVLAALAGRAHAYAAEWSDERQFLADTVDRTPGSIKMHVALIDYELRNNRPTDAERTARLLTERLPQFFQSWAWAAQAAAANGDGPLMWQRLDAAGARAGDAFYTLWAFHVMAAKDRLAAARPGADVARPAGPAPSAPKGAG
jgi:hypothetical protein